jgi:hypothetical protein
MNVYDDAELPPEATIRKFRIVHREGRWDAIRLIEHYNPHAIMMDYSGELSQGATLSKMETVQTGAGQQRDNKE